MSDQENTLYDFLSEILKLTDYGDFSESGFASRCIKSNKSFIDSNCMSYLKRYFSEKNCVTGTQLRKYRKLTKDKPIEEDKVNHILSSYFDGDSETFTDNGEHFTIHLENQIKSAEAYLEYLKLVEEKARVELNLKNAELARNTTVNKLSGHSSSVNELNDLHDDVIKNLHSCFNELTDFVTVQNSDNNIDMDAVDEINSDVTENIKLFLKKCFPEEGGREESGCDIVAHQKLSDLSINLVDSRCKNDICVPRQILELQELRNSKSEMEYGKYLLNYRQDEVTLCLEEVKQFIDNVKEDAFLLNASEMRLMTRANEDKIAILENITKEFSNYSREHFRCEDIFVEILNDKITWKKNEFEAYVEVFRKLAHIVIGHTALNMSIVFLDSVKMAKLQSATDLFSRVDNYLVELFNGHNNRMSALRRKSEQYNTSQKKRLLKLQKLAVLCELDIKIDDEKQGIKSIICALRNIESEVNESIFSVIPTKKLKELHLLERYREELHKIIFNGPMMQPISVEMAVIRRKENIKSKLESLLEQLSILQTNFNEELESSSDIRSIIERVLWILFLVDPDEVKELYKNLDVHTNVC